MFLWNSSSKLINNIIFNNLLGLDVDGQLAYLAHSTNGFYVMNVSNPYNMPSSIGSVNTPGNATDVLIEGNLAYVADGNSGVQIISISDPTSPTIIGSSNTPGNAHRLALQGNTLFVADGSGGVRILDVSDPTNPLNVTSISTPYTRDVDLYGGDLMVATNDGLYSYRVGASGGGLTTLPFVGSYDGYEAWDIRVRGNIAYIAAGPDGLVTLDVSDPANLSVVASCEAPGNAKAVAASEEYAYVTAEDPSRFYVVRRFLDLPLTDVTWVSGTEFRLRRCGQNTSPPTL